MSQRRNYKNNKKGAAGASAATASSVKDTQLQMLSEMFPDWESEDLASLLSEHRNDVEIVIDLIVNKKVSKWEPIKKESRSKRRDDNTKSAEQTSAPVSTTSSTHTASLGEPRGRHSRERQPKTERRRERKPQAGPKKDTPTQAPAAAAPTSAPSLVPASATPSTAPVPSNSWAAALAKDTAKPKPKPAAKSQEESGDSSKAAPSEAQPEAAVEERKSEAPVETAPAKKSSNVQSSTSWASAIKPKAKPAPKKAAEPEPKQAAPSEPEVAEADTPNDEEEEVAASIEEEETADAGPEVAEPEQQPEPVSNPVLESEVVLPQQVDNVGVSFGSLALDDAEPQDQSVTQEQPKEQEMPGFASNQDTADASQQNELSQQSQPQLQQDTAQEQPSQQQTQQETQQSQHQAYQQQYEQQRNANSSQGFDYYSQFQQTQQQFPQQAAAGTLPAQFGYPSFDYSAYGQVNQTPLGSMASPGYYQVNTAKTAIPSAANPSGATEIAQSPLVANSTHQGLQTPQQSQQVPGGAPFAYPNYPNYFYNTPFYGNGAGMGASNTAYGMQQAQQQAQPGSEAGAGEGESASGQSTAQSAQAANQFYAAQYYGNPSQFGTRGAHPYSGYPSSQPFPQGSQAGETTEALQNGQQQGNSQAAPAPSGVPQYYQQMPQYAGYQQYPQYGTYQDNSQYRGWY
ncbi:hypothetical protein METBIDRAFT_9277 [Metschnikowia bicuspidata var. bicuspidata NRRL YB-4993]|uniref:RNA polymerase II degradation factor 1 n=1 Tax=Metschnikowia bicuspidata var. bicuspidata NRRL YB-4993 TaxID=869754 RepID=A0A1A0HGF3_9ASCO|nr:hypothetical protein METBIDRAFT_9277 [Metschnikowia bicuspidata var. bicuspidata NRRL YB-4993]OBA22933.1 hypothetical protein METBIDRAFT_9277 [Metschnikowia bicuspidata var. bicuspidata NRRL YB-4993]